MHLTELVMCPQNRSDRIRAPVSTAHHQYQLYETKLFCGPRYNPGGNTV